MSLKLDTTVIKLGGEVTDNPAYVREVARQLRTVHGENHRLLVVHGGGKKISRELKKQGLKSHFVRGMRVTDAATMEVVKTVLAGTINDDLVRAINATGAERAAACAVGVNGRDGQFLLQARPLNKKEAGGTDYGQVGQVAKVRLQLTDSLWQAGLIPVVAPIGQGDDGLEYNINADVAAAALAVAVNADRLLLLSNIAGVLDAEGRRMPTLNEEQARALVGKGTISEGMIPKIEQALDAVKQGVEAVHILDGRTAGILLNALSGGGQGTVIS